jgi:ferredoxin--NADP+ reductase
VYPIINKRLLAEGIIRIEVHAPLVAEKYKAGQFVILMVNGTGERFPLTIVDGNFRKGNITLIFQIAGKSTSILASKETSEGLFALLGPLGQPSKIEKFGNVVVVGGGVGVSEIYPEVKALKAAGNNVTAIVGFKSANRLFMVDELKPYCDEILITTDDGTVGFKGFVSDILGKLIEEGRKIDYVYAVGPVPMMRAVSNITRSSNIKTSISANPLMIDGTGMCGGCRIEVGGESKFACVDGPEFDAHQVNFDVLEARLKTYKEEENNSKVDLVSK